MNRPVRCGDQGRTVYRDNTWDIMVKDKKVRSGLVALRRTARAIHSSALLALLAPFVVHTALAADHVGAVIQPDYLGAVAVAVGSDSHHPIRYRDAVYALDTVITDDTATTAIEFLDRTRLDVGPGASLRLDNFVYDPASTEGSGEISFAVGAFRYIGGQMTTEENIRLVTPTATMVIRGTELVIFVWPDGRTEVNVVSGAVEVRACGSAGDTQLAMSGMRVTVLPDCVLTRSALRALPAGMAALSLPSATQGGDDPDPDDPGKDRRGDGSSPKGGVDGGGKPGPSNNGGTNNGFGG
ncbi:MAG: FecR domain-containing protein [Rhodospirillaceae bacterium]|nr:FecR domain-containing protein [Rhodospirillaceae bacterium]